MHAVWAWFRRTFGRAPGLWPGEVAVATSLRYSVLAVENDTSRRWVLVYQPEIWPEASVRIRPGQPGYRIAGFLR